MLFIKIKKNKVPAYRELLAEYQLKDEDVAYIGDDLFDLAVMKRVGFPATVADATEEAKSVSILISDFAGGKGAVRQIIEFILKAQEKWQAVIDSYLNIEDETDAKEVEKKYFTIKVYLDIRGIRMKYKLLKYFSAFLCCLSHKLLRLGHILGILYFHLIAKERNRAVDRMMKSFK